MKSRGLVKNVSWVANVNFLLQSAPVWRERSVVTSRFVLITGASTGIGAACAIGCVERGMTVFAGVRNLAACDALRTKAAHAIIPVQLDVTDGESLTKA